MQEAEEEVHAPRPREALGKVGSRSVRLFLKLGANLTLSWNAHLVSALGRHSNLSYRRSECLRRIGLQKFFGGIPDRTLDVLLQEITSEPPQWRRVEQLSGTKGHRSQVGQITLLDTALTGSPFSHAISLTKAKSRRNR